MAKRFQAVRVAVVNKQWEKYPLSAKTVEGARLAGDALLLAQNTVFDSSTLLGIEAVYAKRLYQLLANEFEVSFVRDPQRKLDYVNDLIDTHNYYAYGLAGTALWVLAIPYAFSVLHGETRRGALVFDVADMLKDGLLLPLAFMSARAGLDKSAHKKECAKSLQLSSALPLLFNEIKDALAL